MSSTPPGADTPQNFVENKPPAESKQRTGRVDEPTRFVDWLDWLPWEKILIWGLFLLAVYTLRHFFFIIFMTFIISYIMRSVVLKISRMVSPRKDRAWLERSLTLVCFAALLYGLYLAGDYLGPRLVAQAKALLERGSRVDPKEEFDNFVTKTVGAYAFQRSYGGVGDPRYKEAFEDYQQADAGIKAYQDFPALKERLEKNFLEQEKARIREEISEAPQSKKEFETWLLEKKAPEILERDRERYLEQDEENYRSAFAASIVEKPWEEHVKDPEFERIRRERILRSINKELTNDADKLAKLREEWEEPLVATALTTFRKAEEYEQKFQEFYEAQLDPTRTALQEIPPYTYEKYLALEEAYPSGQDAFLETLQETALEDEETRLARLQAKFEYEKQNELADKFMQSETIQAVIANITPYGEAALKTLTGWIRDGIGYLLTLPIQLALSLLLSFFITFDMPKIRAGIKKLKKSRMSDFYKEIAPGLFNFGRLIGRAFQAQGLIAFFNTVLTFLAIKLIGIQNEIFLSSIVFVCSFIPVLGVVLSSVPIAIMAIVQPNGTVWMALEVIGAILVIHFIETSILNPKILGDMLHLHPVLVLAVLAIGEHFAGVWGLLLGVPVAVYIIRCVILNEDIPGLVEQKSLPVSLQESPEEGPEEGPDQGAGKSFVVEQPEEVSATSSRAH